MEIRHHLEAGVDRVAPIIQLGEAVGRFITLPSTKAPSFGLSATFSPRVPRVPRGGESNGVDLRKICSGSRVDFR
jgi:hypothetical protein